MNPDLEKLLSDCDEIGLTLYCESGKLKYRSGHVEPSELILDRLRQNRDVVTSIVTSWQDSLLSDRLGCTKQAFRADEAIPFVSTKLLVRWFPYHIVPTALVVHGTSGPLYRLTPRVWSFLAFAIDHASATSPAGVTPDLRQAAAIVCDLGDWLSERYRPDQIRRACRAPQKSLPHIGRLPPVFD